MTLTLALPSKGRLREQALEKFAAAGFPVSEPEDARSYKGRMENEPDIEVSFLSASEIARELAAGNLDLGQLEYDAAFGRPLDYYTGLVYEITRDGQALPIAGGGRYDRLLTLLGASSGIPGVGFSIWLDRLPGSMEHGA